MICCTKKLIRLDQCAKPSHQITSSFQDRIDTGASPTGGTDNTVIIVAGVVIVLVVLIIAVSVIVIVVLVLRRQRQAELLIHRPR